MPIPFDELIEEELKAARLSEEAKLKAEDILSDARKKARDMVAHATKAEHIQALLKEEEEKIKKEADEILKDYRKRASRFKEVSQQAFDRAVDGVEIKRVIIIVGLNFSLLDNVNIMDHQEFFINMGRLQQQQPGRSPQS